MSSNPVASKLSRPRRASRAPSRLADENAVSSTTAATSTRLLSKPSNSGLAAGVAGAGAGAKRALTGVTVGVVKQAGAVAGAKDGAGAGQARRAFQDVSNARAQPTDRSSKDLGIKAARTRQTSSSSAVSVASTTSAAPPPQPPSSTGTGLSRLKITNPLSLPANNQARARRVPTAAPTVTVQAPSAPRIPQGEWGRQAYEDDGPIEVLDSHYEYQQEEAMGLGFHDDEGRDPVSEMMESPSARAGIKRKEEQMSSDEVVPEEDIGMGTSQGHKEKVRIVDGEEEDEVDEDDWMVGIEEDEEAGRILREVREEFDEELDYWDTTMVAEYAGEIFQYMGELEESAMPNPRYMEHQTEIEWSMRTTLIDWLLQVHMRYHMLPETLWIAINIIDRFLSNRVVSLVKFQLVGVTAMFVAAKYEEIMAPSVDEFVFMTEGGYTREEILKGERIILSSLDFNISPYCSPYTWVRRISKADDYDIQTRTLSKFLMEVTLLDHRFLRAKPSMIAAIGMYLARRMLGGEWNESFIYYSSYTEAQLLVPTGFLIEAIAAPDFDQKFVYKKYSNKKFLKASLFARNWAKSHVQESSAESSGDA
ncbi:G2/mitotic-specific cyclin 3/4 [Pseudohyphozyma bogoriensis]|nr:G2/mitotic-specific cyclin 3/4 [Pseudohyphozyma bogoriensis]